jgi:hypothetical protein
MTRIKSYLDWDKIKKIEDMLNRIKFREMPIGEMLSHYLSSISDQGYFDPTTKENIKYKLLEIKYGINYRNDFQTNIIPEDCSGKILFGLTDNSRRLTDFIAPLANLFGYDNSIIFGNKNDEFLPDEKPIFRYVQGFSTAHFKEWKFQYLRAIIGLTDTLNKLKIDLEIPDSIINQLKFFFKIQSQRSIVIIWAIEKLNPHCLIVDHDRQFDNSLLLGICKSKKIPTFTLIHGLTLPAYSSFPVLANYILAWGDFHLKQFSGLGIAKDRILVCGNYKINKILSVTRDSYKGEFFKEKSKKIILYASTNFDFAQKLKITREFCEATFELKDKAYYVVRLHPLESKLDFKDLIVEFPHVMFLTQTELNFEESLGLPDLIIGHNTAFIVDAYLKMKPILVFDSNSINYPIGLGGIIKENDKIFYAKNTIELQQEINNFLESELKTHNNNTDWFCKLLGEESLRKYKEEIDAKLSIV